MARAHLMAWTWADAKRALNGHQERAAPHGTYTRLEAGAGDSVVLRHYAAPVATWRPDGTVVLCPQRFSVTTLRRVSDYTAAQPWTEAGETYILANPAAFRRAADALPSPAPRGAWVKLRRAHAVPLRDGLVVDASSGAVLPGQGDACARAQHPSVAGCLKVATGSGRMPGLCRPCAAALGGAF